MSPRKAEATEQSKDRNLFTNSPVGSPIKRPTEPPFSVGVTRKGKGSGKEAAAEDESLETATQLSSPLRPGSLSMADS